MQPWDVIFEANKEKLINIPFFRMTYEATLKYYIKSFKENELNKREASPLIVKNTKNSYPMFAELYSDFTAVLDNEEKAKFKDQCKVFINSLPDAELRSQIDILY